MLLVLDIENWIRNCDLCESRKMPKSRGKAPLQQYTPGGPLE